ncbi:MAG: tRNA (adenosine(37)-N6)-dimethylallyltransferase MiaA, partial [Clostridiales bacterium]|nr:tRNA (adenosine(37)-N6)-dimethylallyltransferase MiaA [Clostridiales bacterium]
MDLMIRVCAVVGPTASGKSALAIELARSLDGEIVSCDSMQLYRGMDIGTAKPTKAEQEEIVHHMIDILSPMEKCSAADYAAAAFPLLKEIAARGKLPIFCGGTGLYLESVLYDRYPVEIPAFPACREALYNLARERG